uniref:Uncharacterized protein n=1 Tax=Nelumbo nucifera TaxID=4432 RepID=A0A822XZ26_NELNU|nr:TPA_asm: hypothetical protein HUJ06_025926 [Nelumbo nucifera]
MVLKQLLVRVDKVFDSNHQWFQI